MRNSLAILRERGFISQCTDEAALADLLDQQRITMYVGVDPTAASLHVGHLVPYMAMAHLQKAGHRPLVVLGTGTALIGDPSGKSEMRRMLSLDQIQTNARAIAGQLARIIDFSEKKAELVNNYDWLGSLNYLEFLRDIGSHFSVNRMLSFESYKARLENGLSFIEFNYQLLQSYDFWMLFKNYGCQLQLGGDDQWGNIVAGLELIRRLERKSVYGLTMPLLTTAGDKKMGKTEKGALFLDPKLVTPYEYYQFWRNTADADVGRFLRLFTFLPMSEIKPLEEGRGAELNTAKEVLAFEQTRLIHGDSEARKAKKASADAFGASLGALGPAVPAIKVSAVELADGVSALELFARTPLCASRSEARRLIEQGGAWLDNKKVDNIEETVKRELKKGDEILLRAGKKRYHRIAVI